MPASPALLDALEQVEVTTSDRDRSGFQLRFAAGRSGPAELADYPLLAGSDLNVFCGEGVSFRGCRFFKPRSGGNLTNADLTEADLSDAVFDGADFSGAKLVGAKMPRSDLRGTRFAGAGLRFELKPHIFMRTEFRDYVTMFPTQIITPAPGAKFGKILNDIVPTVSVSYEK